MNCMACGRSFESSSIVCDDCLKKTFKFRNVRKPFPGNYVWCINLSNRTCYAQMPDGTIVPSDGPDSGVFSHLAFAFQCVNRGRWELVE